MAQPRSRLQPHIDHGAKVWLKRYAQKHLWRVMGWYELDDLIQDGLMVFCRVIRHYEGRVVNQAHLMRLMQIAFINHLNDLSKRKTLETEVPISSLLGDGEDEAVIYDQHLSSEQDDSLTTLAPADIKRVLSALGRPEANVKRRPVNPDHNHLPNSKLARLHRYYDEHGRDAAWRYGRCRLHLSKNTIKKQFSLIEKARREGQGYTRETHNERLCRLAGVDASTNMVERIREYLTVG